MTYIRSDMCLRAALKHMLLHDTKYAVVKRGSREVGMIGESVIHEVLNKQSLNLDNLEESKGENYFEPSSRADSLLYDRNQNRISKDRFGNELSRISCKADQLSSLDSQDRDDIESCRLTVQGDTSIVRTEACVEDRKQ